METGDKGYHFLAKNLANQKGYALADDQLPTGMSEIDSAVVDSPLSESKPSQFASQSMTAASFETTSKTNSRSTGSKEPAAAAAWTSDVKEEEWADF